MSRRIVCAVTGSRADFGVLSPLLSRLLAEPSIELRLAVTGSHLNHAFGNTISEIEESGFHIHTKIRLPIDSDSKHAMARTTGYALSSFADYFSSERPELIVLLGDSFEIFAAAAAGALMGIPIAHLSGGDTTEGAVDEFLRHSITKMSTLHFTGCEDSRRRVIQLGESPDRVFNVGEPGIENMAKLSTMTLDELRADIGFPRAGRVHAVVTFHPVTLEDHSESEQLRELIQAMDYFPELDYIITLSNADAGGREINRIWTEAQVSHPNWLVVPSLGAKRYHSALRHAQMVLGNSSSGVIEAPFYHTPTVNIGDRQKGRIMAESVLCCQPVVEEIVSAMQRVMTPEFKDIAGQASSPFGDGHTSEKILPVLLSFLDSDNKETKKTFYDVPFND